MIEAGSNTFTVDLHRRLTVIAGMGRIERESLIGEIVGALGSSRTGVHLELTDDEGRHLAVFRPEGAHHRIVDVDAAEDVSGEYADADGRVDLLHRAGIDLRTARHRMRLSAAELRDTRRGDALIRHLASLDQSGLWAAADRIRATDIELQAEAEATGTAPEDAEIVERIEQRHTASEKAAAGKETSRQRAVLGGAVSAVGAVPSMLLFPLAALGLLLVVMALLGMSLVYARRVDRTRKAEEEALAEAGAHSYLGFHLQRVNGLLASDRNRRRVMGAADQHREALATWKQLAGDVHVDWAFDHQEEIVAAARLRTDADSLGKMSATAPAVDHDATTELAHALVSRISELRNLGAHGEAFPLILDDSFTELEPSMKPSLLELLGRTAGTPQIVFLTEDEDVASWARLEAMTGEVAILEPSPENDESADRTVQHQTA